MYYLELGAANHDLYSEKVVEVYDNESKKH